MLHNHDYLCWPQSKWWLVGYHSFFLKVGMVLEKVYIYIILQKIKHTKLSLIRDHSKKSWETVEVAYICRYTGGHCKP